MFVVLIMMDNRVQQISRINKKKMCEEGKKEKKKRRKNL